MLKHFYLKLPSTYLCLSTIIVKAIISVLDKISFPERVVCWKIKILKIPSESEKMKWGNVKGKGAWGTFPTKSTLVGTEKLAYYCF